MTTFTYPIQVKGGDTNRISNGFLANGVFTVQKELSLGNIDTSATEDTAVGVVPAGVKVQNWYLDVISTLEGTSVSGGRFEFGTAASVSAFGTVLVTVANTGRYQPVFTAAQLNRMYTYLSTDTSLAVRYTTSTSGVPTKFAGFLVYEVR